MQFYKHSNPYTGKPAIFRFKVDKLWKHHRPTQVEIHKVAEILNKEASVSKAVTLVQDSADTPFHAGHGLSIDSIVRVILSQACTNEVALQVQQTMLVAYPYWVDGEKFVGTKPNYHAMRMEGLSKLAKVFKAAGFDNKKPAAVKKILDLVHARNAKDLAVPVRDQVLYNGNEPGAKDFVPGTLSVDYIWEIYRKEGKQGVMDYFTSLPQIAVKSACCLMSFNMGLPVFAVDTHVQGMASLLG